MSLVSSFILTLHRNISVLLGQEANLILFGSSAAKINKLTANLLEPANPTKKIF